jgi:quercetin dioxygenase-like cupin family protein
MEIKRNEATRNRPEGDRVIDAPYVFADLAKFLEQVKSEKAWEKNDRNGITIFKTEGMTMVITILKEGAVIKDNTVNGHFTIQVLHGQLNMTTLEGDADLNVNQLITFHPGIPHSLEAKRDTVMLLTTVDVQATHPIS